MGKKKSTKKKPAKTKKVDERPDFFVDDDAMYSEVDQFHMQKDKISLDKDDDEAEELDGTGYEAGIMKLPDASDDEDEDDDDSDQFPNQGKNESDEEDHAEWEEREKKKKRTFPKRGARGKARTTEQTRTSSSSWTTMRRTC